MDINKIRTIKIDIRKVSAQTKEPAEQKSKMSSASRRKATRSASAKQPCRMGPVGGHLQTNG